MYCYFYKREKKIDYLFIILFIKSFSIENL